jgi:hypothetical protein
MRTFMDIAKKMISKKRLNAIANEIMFKAAKL